MKIYKVVDFNGYVRHVFADRELAQRYIDVLRQMFLVFHIEEFETDDSIINQLTVQYINANIVWDATTFSTIVILVSEEFFDESFGVSYIGTQTNGGLVSISRKYNGEDVDLIKTSYEAILKYYMEKVKKMVAEGLKQDDINKELSRERGGW